MTPRSDAHDTRTRPRRASVAATRPSNVSDPYPTRRGEPPALLPRIDPVVHGEGAPGPLTAAQVEAFERHGFVVLENLLDPGEVAALDAAVSGRIADLDGTDAVVREPGSDEVRSIFAFHVERDHHRRGPLDRVAGDPRLAGAARQLLGSDVYVHQSRVNRKPALRGRDFQWHSDFETWHAEDGMPRMRALSASVWLTDNHEWNGSLQVMPGTHRWFATCSEPTPPRNHERSLRAQEVGVPDDETLFELYERSGITNVTGPAGSVLLFDCNLLHASPSNVSPLSRRNLFLVYNSVENALEEPFAARERRPEHLATRTVEPLRS